MKRLILFLTAVAMILCSCEKIEPASNTQNTNNENRTYVHFTYNVVSPRQVVFNYMCTQNIRYFMWDFGDGTYDSENQGTNHIYKNPGTYTVELSGQTSKGGDVYSYKQNITLLNPKAIYIKSFTFEEVPNPNKYYRVYMYDDDWFTNNWELNSLYTQEKLPSKNMPFTKKLYPAKVMDKLSGDNYYNVEVYYSDTRNGDGTQCFKGKITKEKILEYYPSYRYKSNGLVFTIDMDFSY